MQKVRSGKEAPAGRGFVVCGVSDWLSEIDELELRCDASGEGVCDDPNCTCINRSLGRMLRDHARDLIDSTKELTRRGLVDSWWSCGKGHVFLRLKLQGKFEPQKECPACTALAEVKRLTGEVRAVVARATASALRLSREVERLRKEQKR